MDKSIAEIYKEMHAVATELAKKDFPDMGDDTDRDEKRDEHLLRMVEMFGLNKFEEDEA